MTLSDLDLANRLRDQRTRTAEIPPPPVDLAQRVRQRAADQRRRQIRLTAAGVAAALVFVGLPALAEGWLPDGSRGEQASPPSRSNPAPSHLDLPTRGSLAGDGDWLSGVRALSWLPEGRESYPPREELPDSVLARGRKVVFAGDVPGGRVALVVARRADDSLMQAWFTGPEGASPGQMRLATTPTDASPQAPLALVSTPDPDRDDAVVVLVAQPGDEAEVLTGREVAASGEVRELWEPMQLFEGAGGIALGHPMVFPPSLEIRITRPGRSGEVHAQFQFGDEMGRTLPAPLEAADPRGLLGTVDADEVRWAVEGLVTQYGLPVEQLSPTLLFAGQVAAGSTTSVVLVGVTFPSGATTTSLTVYRGMDDGGMTVTTSSADPAPAGTALLDRLVAIATSTVVTVSGPVSGVTAELYRDDGTPYMTVPLVDGAGSAPRAPTRAGAAATVRVLDADGALVAEAAVEQQ